jgi:tryptophan halogenase
MKITVLGRGNAGCLTALHYGYYTRKAKDISVELLYDPDILPERVGVGTLLDFPKLLWNALGINWYDNPIDATPKFGILYENWGKTGEKSFASPFPLHHLGCHYSNIKLQETILKSGLFRVEEKHIDNYEQIDSDYIFDCRGWPTDYNDYNILTNPLNAVLLGEGKSKECDINWTRAVATPDGWTFVIPKTTQTTSYGYLYNDEITSIEEAAANFKKLFNLEKQGINLNEKVDNFKFKNYVAKKPIIDDRIILNGNKLFFLEPLEATANQTYLVWARDTWNWIIEKRKTPALCAQNFHKYTYQIQNFVMWHYTYGSKYDTPFWSAAKKLEIKDPEFDEVVEYIKKFKMIDLIEDDSNTYGQWEPWNFKCWHDGMTKERK